MFKDRKDAGKKLALALEKYKNKNVLVLAIPRGGVEVAYYVAQYLNADLSLIISRKLPYPDDPEAGFGAIAEDGSIFIFPHAKLLLSKKEINCIKEEQLLEIKRRIKILRNRKPLPIIRGRTVILVDDGLAMGSTMRVTIMLCKKRKASKIVVAVPVSGKEVAKEIQSLVDELIVLEQPEFFQAVAQVYRNWYDVPDQEVLNIIRKYNKIKINKKILDINQLHQQIRDCKKCGLWKSCNNAVPGEGSENANTMLIGQNPGAEEDRIGRPFVGRAGKYLNKVLEKNNIDRKKIFITSVVKHKTPNNRKPTKEEIRACLPYLIQQIRIIKPKIVVLMGEVAWQTPRFNNIKYIETYHPAAAMRFPKIRKRFEKDFKKL